MVIVEIAGKHLRMVADFDMPLFLILQSLAVSGVGQVFFVKHFSLKRASEFPVFVKGISLLSAGHSYASRRMRACSIR